MGNKTPILNILYALFPRQYNRYIEPFGGSGAVLLGIDKVVVKSHGSSKAESICASVLQAKDAAASGLISTG